MQRKVPQPNMNNEVTQESTAPEVVETAPVAKAKRVRKAVVKVVAPVALAKAKRTPAKAKKAVKAVAKRVVVEEIRPYEFRLGSTRRPFTKEQKAAIRKSIREVGIVATAEQFNSVPAYITALSHTFRMKVALGRRPSVNA
jgi:hypothetical protein